MDRDQFIQLVKEKAITPEAIADFKQRQADRAELEKEDVRTQRETTQWLNRQYF